jgi:hypothetical protein
MVHVHSSALHERFLEHVYCGVHAHCGTLLSVDGRRLMKKKKMTMKKKEEEEKTMMLTKTTS